MALVDARAGRGARVLPHSLDAEKSVLGAMLLSREAIGLVSETLHGDDFYIPAHGHIFEAVTALYASGHPVDPVTVAEELERSDLLEMVGGAAALIEIQDRTPATTSAPRYAEIVSELALLRRLIAECNEIAEIGYGRPEDVVKAIDDAEARIYSVAQRRITTTTAPLGELLSSSLDRLEELYERGDAITGTPTGFIDLDRLLSGLQPSALIVVGARPAMGKTSFALGMAANAALSKDAKPVLMFSLEMSQVEITQRLLCSQAKVDASHIRNGRLTPEDWTSISHTVGTLAEAPIWIDDNPNVTVMEIRSKARRLKSKLGDLGLIIIDYIQLMSGSSGAESRQVEVAEISRGLKILARELDVPVVALAQLNRGLEARTEKRPMLSDLRESGSLEQDADVVMFLYRDEVYHPDSADSGMGEVIVAKHRAGPTGLVRLAFNGKYTLFDNMAHAGPDDL